MELFDVWMPEIELLGFPIALVAQDGIENLDVPWNLIKTIFIGGTTTWKESEYAVRIIRAAQWMGKHVHIGRVNTAPRWEYFEKLGANTFDGSGLVRPYPGARKNRACIAQSVGCLQKEFPALHVGLLV
jgi:hypothetical protein